MNPDQAAPLRPQKFITVGKSVNSICNITIEFKRNPLSFYFHSILMHSSSIQIKICRSGSRISGKWVHMYKGVGDLADFI